MNIFETIREEIQHLADKVALIEGESRLTYGQLLRAVDEAAETLRRAGIRPADRVAFLCEDSIDYIIGSLAILARSAVVVPISPSLMAHEIDAVMARIDVRALVFDKAVYRHDQAADLAAEGFLVKRFGLLRRAIQHLPPEEFAGLTPAFIRFSSGTTGASKGVVLSHATIVARTNAANQGLQIMDDDVVIWVLSMSFHFVVTILLFLRRGVTLVLCHEPFPAAFLDGVQKHHGTVLYASPFHYQVLATSPAAAPESLARIRLAVATAMKLPVETAAVFTAKYGFELAEAYGIIEVGLPFINLNIEPGKRGSVGRPLPDYEVRIDAPDADGAGEILIRGPGLLDAYFSPWQNRDQIMPDGWFHTGDIGRLDVDGYLFIVGRRKNMINFTGMKIFPEDVEAVLNQFPRVRESLVYPTPHPHYGQLPVAKLVVDKTGDEPFDLAELRRFCFQRLAPFQVPKEFHIVEQIEKTASGKLRRY